MSKDVNTFLSHILENITFIEEYIEDKNEEEFMGNRQLQDAIIRRIEIVGEAVKNLPSDFTNRHSNVKWNAIARMRDKLIHKYFGVDLKLTFDVVKNDLPELKKQINSILNGFKNNKP